MIKNYNFPLKDKLPFQTFGLLQDSNEVNINQTKQYIKIIYPEYINWILWSYNWYDDEDISSQNTSPLSEDCIHNFYAKVSGPNDGYSKKGTLYHVCLQEEMGFSYQILLGELIFSSVSGSLDIAYDITTLSKFLCC